MFQKQKTWCGNVYFKEFIRRPRKYGSLDPLFGNLISNPTKSSCLTGSKSFKEYLKLYSLLSGVYPVSRFLTAETVGSTMNRMKPLQGEDGWIVMKKNAEEIRPDGKVNCLHASNALRLNTASILSALLCRLCWWTADGRSHSISALAGVAIMPKCWWLESIKPAAQQDQEALFRSDWYAETRYHQHHVKHVQQADLKARGAVTSGANAV